MSIKIGLVFILCLLACDGNFTINNAGLRRSSRVRKSTESEDFVYSNEQFRILQEERHRQQDQVAKRNKRQKLNNVECPSDADANANAPVTASIRPSTSTASATDAEMLLARDQYYSLVAEMCHAGSDPPPLDEQPFTEYFMNQFLDKQQQWRIPDFCSICHGAWPERDVLTTRAGMWSHLSYPLYIYIYTLPHIWFHLLNAYSKFSSLSHTHSIYIYIYIYINICYIYIYRLCGVQIYEEI